MPRPTSAIEDGAARGAEVPAVMHHARSGTANVRKVLLTQPHRVRLAGGALLRGPLLRGSGRRREGEREADQRGGSHDRPELRLCSVHIDTSVGALQWYILSFVKRSKLRRVIYSPLLVL